MKVLQSTWFLGGFALITTVIINTLLMMNAFSGISQVIEPPKQKVVEISSVFWTFRTREIENLIHNLKEKNNDLKNREKSIMLIEDRIQAEKHELDELKKSIEMARDALAKRIAEIEQAEEKNLKVLASTYASMTPDATVRVFGKMPDLMVVKIVKFMSAEIVGAIFQAMANSNDIEGVSSERVAKLSELMRLSIQEKKAGG